MNGQDPKTEIFDVFLCHNSEDKPVVREIAQKLAEKHIKPWLDEEQIRPGTSWQTALGQQIKSIKSAAVFMGASGLGPWQDQEIQSFLNQFVHRKCPVIPVILPSAKSTPELSWPLENLNRVDFRTDSQPLERLVWGITGQKPAALSDVPSSEKPATMREATKSHLLSSRDEHAAAHKAFSEVRLYPPLAEPPDQEQATQLEILRGRVMEYWVDGVLKHSLYGEVLISLGKRQIDKTVDAPWKYTVEVSDATSLAPLDDRDFSAIYDAAGLLLILGEPGSGKTTTLLDLARALLERARDDIKERVPIVLNLSSWKKQPLAEWISGELSEKYRVPRKIACFWLQHHYLLPLLDGLDEIKTLMQPDCVAAINTFIEESNPPGLVVCCRLNEYQWLPERLKLNGAIRLEPLSKDEVAEYFTKGGAELAGLRKAVNTDPVLQELTQTPLMLSVMSLAYQGIGDDELATQKGDSAEERRKQIFRLYVERMFQRRGMASLAFPKEKIIGWLSWLAGKMREHSQSVFHVEGFQPSWLGTRAKRVAYGTIVASSLALIFALSVALISGLNSGLSHRLYGLSDAVISGLSLGLPILVGLGLGCWSNSPLKNGVMSGSIGGLIGGLIHTLTYGLSDAVIYGLIVGLTVIYGLIVGLIAALGAGSLNHITLVETMSWKWNQFWKKTISGSILGLISAMIVELTSWLSWLRYVSVGPREVGEILTYGLIGGLIVGLVNGFFGGFTDSVKAGKVSPNQGIKLSLKYSLAAFLIAWFTVGLIAGLIGGLRLGQRLGLSEDLIVGLIGGLLLVGLLGGLNRGGSAVIKHCALRLILWLNGYTPFKFIEFLDHCAKLILLKKVGGDYMFIHRMLLEYFADISVEHTSVKR